MPHMNSKEMSVLHFYLHMLKCDFVILSSWQSTSIRKIPRDLWHGNTWIKQRLILSYMVAWVGLWVVSILVVAGNEITTPDIDVALAIWVRTMSLFDRGFDVPTVATVDPSDCSLSGASFSRGEKFLGWAISLKNLPLLYRMQFQMHNTF